VISHLVIALTVFLPLVLTQSVPTVPVFLPLVLMQEESPFPPPPPPVPPLAARYGFGWPTRSMDISKLVGGLPTESWWFFDWSSRCTEVNQIPIVRLRVTDDLAACNDGRDVMVANEPDWAGQDNMTPCAVADLAYAVASQWKGQVWCCGTFGQNLAYMRQVIACFEDRYGYWDAYIYGLHIHGYSNGATWAPDVHKPEKIALGVDYVRQTADALAADGNSFQNHIMISEYGVLSRYTLNYGPGLHWPSQMPAVWKTYESEFAKEPRIEHLAWFSIAYEVYNTSDMVQADGSLFPVGELWRQAAAAW
jgi:hypothetical protein